MRKHLVFTLYVPDSRFSGWSLNLALCMLLVPLAWLMSMEWRVSLLPSWWQGSYWLHRFYFFKYPLFVWHISKRGWFDESYTLPHSLSCVIRRPLWGYDVGWDPLLPAHSGPQIGLVIRETGHGVCSRSLNFSLSRCLFSAYVVSVTLVGYGK